MPDLKTRIKTYAVAIALPVAVGVLSALLTMDNMQIYSEIRTPPLSPPSILFPIVWTILYVLMGIAAGIVVKSEDVDSGKAMTLYYLQLGLNVLWPLLFFRFEWISLAAVWLLLLTAAVYATWQRFREINAVAGWLLVPYLLWCVFALYLNVGFAVLN